MKLATYLFAALTSLSTFSTTVEERAINYAKEYLEKYKESLIAQHPESANAIAQVRFTLGVQFVISKDNESFSEIVSNAKNSPEKIFPNGAVENLDKATHLIIVSTGHPDPVLILVDENESFVALLIN